MYRRPTHWLNLLTCSSEQQVNLSMARIKRKAWPSLLHLPPPPPPWCTFKSDIGVTVFTIIMLVYLIYSISVV